MSEVAVLQNQLKLLCFARTAIPLKLNVPLRLLTFIRLLFFSISVKILQFFFFFFPGFQSAFTAHFICSKTAS